MNLIRILCGLLIVLNLLPLGMTAMGFVSKIAFDYNEVNDEIALCQLREDLLISYDMEYSRDVLRFTYEGKSFRLSQVNRMLVLQPGTQIFLYDIDDLHFEKRGTMIYVLYRRKGKEYERILATEGLYLSDFSDCPVIDDEYRDGESGLYQEGE